jgi:hypothetical protein
VRKPLPALVFILAVFILFSSSCFAAIHVIEEPGVDAVMAKNVRTVVASFDQLIAEEMKVSLNHDVKVFIAPTQSAYAVVLQRELGQSRDAAERNAKVTGGMSHVRHQAVALNGESSVMKSLGSVATLVAHELFHQIQGQLEGEKRYRLYWMSEGSADYVGARIAEKLGVMNLVSWKQQRINQLGKSSIYASANELAFLSASEWTTLMEAKKYPYEVSDLMLLYVLERSGKGIESITEYFRLCGKTMDGSKALSAVFGMDLATVNAGFSPWLVSRLAKTGEATVEAIGSVPDTSLQSVQLGVGRGFRFITEKLGIAPTSSFRLFVTASSDDYVRALTKELGISPDIAATRRNETWRYSKGVAVIQAAGISTDALRARIGGLTLARMWMDDYLPRKSAEPLYWLRQGGAILIGCDKEQRDSWKKLIVGDRPSLSELRTQTDLAQAEKKFGVPKVEAMCGMAVTFLTETYGTEKLGEWLTKTKEKGDATAAFLSVYGKTPQEVEKEFIAWLQ